MSHSHHNHREDGVSNVEIDWFLRGKLPEATTPMPIPKKHVESSPQPAEQSIHEALQHVNHNSRAEQEIGCVLSRSKSLSAVETRNEKEKKGGFFRSLFGKKKSKEGGSSESLASPRTASPLRVASPEPIREMKSLTTPYTNGSALHKSKTSGSVSELDPRLEEFLRYYKAKNLDKLHKAAKTDTTTSAGDGLSSSSSSIQSSTNDLKISAAPTPTSRRVDALGRPIPPHPPRAPFPPAITKQSRFDGETKAEGNFSALSTSSKLTGFLRRHHSTVSEGSGSLSRVTSRASERSEKPVVKIQPTVIPGLENLPRLKRVSFDIPVFFNDPPQQIPSRTPRKGEVEILKDGSIVIHKLSVAERRQIMNQSGGGIVVGGTGHLKVISHPQDEGEGSHLAEPITETRIEAKETSGTENKSDDEASVPEDVDSEYQAQHHSIKVAAAAAAAEARGMEGGQELRRISTNNDEDVTVSDGAAKIGIDKPMIRHNKSSASLQSLSNSEAASNTDTAFPPLGTKVPLDILYTRCCHLREILPIPATLKQLKPGSTDPVSTLQLRNPKPSLVEVLTFSDFISIAPILCISLDGVSMSSEMLRIILSSLVHKKELEKLTLRNTPIDEMGWKLICWFLTKHQTLSRLDLTQVPLLPTGVQKPAKKAANTSTINRMECDMTSRSDMNWNLLSAALASRGGIDELVINGAKMSDEEFKNLMDLGVVPSTTKLGLAYNDLTLSQMESFSARLNDMRLIGLDLGYNDLGDKLGPVSDYINHKRSRSSVLQFLSLNSCNLDDNNGFMDTVLNEFAVFKDLRYIDLSNNKKMFPSAMISLTECLPIYPKLARIHLDYNDLSQGSIVALAELIPFCKSLRYISLVGNAIDSVSAGALTNAMKLSKTVMTLDIDYENVSPKYRETIGLYAVRNMQNNLTAQNSENHTRLPNERDMNGLREQLSRLLSHEDETNTELAQEFVNTALRIRDRIHESIDELFNLRLQGKLNVEGKEALIRLCYVDASIEKGLSLLNKKNPDLNLSRTMGTSQTDNDNKLPPSASSTSLAPASVPVSRTSSSNLAMAGYLDGHHELLPFGVAQANDSSDDDDQQLRLIKDSGDMLLRDEGDRRSTDKNKLQEEAHALKFSGLIRKSGLHNMVTEQHISQLQELSGDKLRGMLRETDDFRNIGSMLDKLKQEGIGLAEIYKKGVTNTPAGGIMDAETLNNTAKNINERNTIVEGDEPHGSDSDQSILSDADEDEELDQAYDEILDHLERTRTNN